MVDLSKESTGPEGSVCVLKGIFVDNVKGGEVESLFLVSEDMSEDLVDLTEAGMNVSSKEGNSVFET